ncbi:MAG: hypothetical protein M2R45_03158 [Verrucomicrobia subdivision 3 bacterium]|nr:hypothetical protein [Limisphaerales bacterium]MCS1413225.1 hypothetical protein [Limisphaerales bacterium]
MQMVEKLLLTNQAIRGFEPQDVEYVIAMIPKSESNNFAFCRFASAATFGP